MALLPGAALYGLAAVDTLVYLAFGAYTLRRRAEPGAWGFLGFLGLMVALPTVVVASAEWLALRRWRFVPVAVFHAFGPLWASFAFEYTGELDWNSNRWAPLLVVPSTVGVLTVWYVLSTGAPSIPPTAGPVQAAYLLTAMYTFALVFGSTLWLVQAGLRYASTDHRLFLSIAAGVLGVVTLPTVFSGAFGGGENHAAGYLLAYLVSAVPFGAAMFRYDLFESVPIAEAIGRDTVVTELDDPVVVVDDEERVVDANAAAERTFGVSLPTAAGASLEAVIDGGGWSVDRLSADETVTFRNGARPRHYEVSVSQLAGESDGADPLGHALVFHDVTDRQTRRQRLEVFDRVLRHNLRNEMTTITGNAAVIANGRDADATVLASDIKSAGERLTGLSERARQVDRLMAVEPRPTTLTVGSVVEDVVADVTGAFDDGATVDNEVPGDLTATVDRSHLETVLTNLLDNAVRHGGGEVTVDGRRTDDERLPIEVVVADEGPGIPEAELAVIRDREESDLEHASGLGLWTVAWGTTRMGGDVEFETDETGTTVRLRLPASEATLDRDHNDEDPVSAT